MARKIYPYSLDRKDAKIAGVARRSARCRDRPDLHPHRLRRRRDLHQLQADADRLRRDRHLPGDAEEAGDDRRPPDERFRPHGRGRRSAGRPSTRCVNDLDETDRRLMAIDHHINTQNDELAREIEALRQEEK